MTSHVDNLQHAQWGCNHSWFIVFFYLQARKTAAEEPEKSAKEVHEAAWKEQLAIKEAEKDKIKATEAFSDIDSNKDQQSVLWLVISVTAIARARLHSNMPSLPLMDDFRLAWHQRGYHKLMFEQFVISWFNNLFVSSHRITLDELQLRMEFDSDGDGTVTAEEVTEVTKYTDASADLGQFIEKIWPEIKAIYSTPGQEPAEPVPPPPTEDVPADNAGLDGSTDDDDDSDFEDVSTKLKHEFMYIHCDLWIHIASIE